MASAEIPNSSPDATNPAAAAAATGPDSSSPPLPPRKRRLSPSQSPARSASRSRSPRSRSSRGRRSRSLSRSRSRSRSRSPQYPPDGKRRRHNDLNVEACRDFLRDRCTRSDLECRYAHPHNSVSVDRDNKVTACADSLRNNCFRGRTCRYYHPPPHIQEQLMRSIGVEDPKVKTQICRDFTCGKCSRSANECRFLHHSSVEDVAIVCQDFLRGQCNRIACRYSHAVAHPVPPMSHVPMPYPEMLYMPPPPPPPPLGVPMMGPLPSPPMPFADNKNRVEVCRDFLKNMCTRESCRFAHPDTHTTAASANVEVCRDFKRGECNRPACRYFHPYTS